VADTNLSLEFLRVVEQAAIASAHTMGQGDGHRADRAAVEAMRRELDRVPISGTIVIGEGERDRAPMLYIGEPVGTGRDRGAAGFREIDIAVDPLEGTNLCSTGAPGAIAVLAASEKGGLLHAPDLYMEKLVVPPPSKHVVDLDAPVGDNLRAIAASLDRAIADLVIVVLDRPRHEQLVSDIRATGARIRLISDGDLSAAIVAAVVGTGVHAVMGIGGAPDVDEAVANHLVRTVDASRLMGASVIITGLSPEIAETLVTIGVDLSKMNTIGDLQGGLEEAERLLGYTVSRQNGPVG